MIQMHFPLISPSWHSLHRNRDETEVVAGGGVWWAKKEIVKVRVGQD